MDLVRVVALSIPLSLVPQWAIASGSQRFEPYELMGWAWRFLISLPLAVVMMAIVGPLAWAFFLRSSFRRTSTFVILCAMPPLAFQMVGFANVALDRQVGRPVIVDCVNYIHHARGPNQVEVTSWTDPGRTVTLRAFVVSECDCSARKPVRLTVHPGRLGAQWISTPR